MDTLPRRQQDVLRATVRHYVDTVEPVGSNTLVRRFGLPASPATVRSAMGALELRGLLTQPHTSAGRIPSQQGYRLYVDQLLPEPGSAARQLERELAGVSLQWAALDDLLLHLARRLADLTGLLSLITRPQRQRPQLQAIRLVASSDRLLVFLVQSSALTREQVIEIFEAVKSAPKAIVVNTAVPRPWKVANNALISEVAANYPNISVIPWDQISQGLTEYFAPDGVHLVPAGVRAYVAAIETKL